MTPDTWSPVAGLVCAVVGAALGLLVPDAIRRLPEPVTVVEPPSADEPGPAPEDEAGEVVEPPGAPVDQPKETYAAIAALPGLRWKTAVASAAAAGLIGARVGWDPALLFLLYLAPLGVALALVDWRTRLLPTRLIAPSYAVVLVLAAAAAGVSGDWRALLLAGAGWLVAGGTFAVLWIVYPAGMGYGDVRLAGLLGIALGYLGWSALLTGVYLGFLLGGIGGFLLARLRIVDRKAFPFGPFMLVGALTGILVAPHVAAWYV